MTDFPHYNESLIDKDLEEKMEIAQKASSMVLALRRKEKLKVRQPLAKIIVPVLNPHFQEQFEAVKNIVLAEVNVKEVEFLTDTSGIIKKKIKPNFKTLGPKFGKQMKQIAALINSFNQDQIAELEQKGTYDINISTTTTTLPPDEPTTTLTPDDVEIYTEDIPGWTVASEGKLTVALDINVTEELREEGIAREFINKIQNLRKENNFEVTDRINLTIEKHNEFNAALLNHKDYICTQTLANQLILVEKLTDSEAKEVEIDKNILARILVERVNQR